MATYIANRLRIDINAISMATYIAQEPYSEWGNRARCGFPTLSDDIHVVSTPSGVSPNGVIF